MELEQEKFEEEKFNIIIKGSSPDWSFKSKDQILERFLLSVLRAYFINRNTQYKWSNTIEGIFVIGFLTPKTSWFNRRSFAHWVTKIP